MSVLPAVATFIEAASMAGWQIDRRDAREPLLLPAEITQRYGSPPAAYGVFLSEVARATSADEGVWFLCERELNPSDAGAFAWNEMEKMALESANDGGEIQRVVSFWDRHFPIMMAPNGDYDFLAIVVSGVGQASVVHGCAAGGEEVSQLAESFEQWLAMLGQALRAEAGGAGGPLALKVMSRRAEGATPEAK